jgi:hypothetical protein
MKEGGATLLDFGVGTELKVLEAGGGTKAKAIAGVAIEVKEL